MSDGSPCVAHLVCPIPQCPYGLCSFFIFSVRFFNSPFALHTDISPFSNTAIPAESYPLYSSLLNESINTSAQSLLPTYPTIPHIICSSCKIVPHNYSNSPSD